MPFDPNVLRSNQPYFAQESLQKQIIDLQADVAALTVEIVNQVAQLGAFEVATDQQKVGDSSDPWPWDVSGGGLAGASLSIDDGITLPTGRYQWYVVGDGLWVDGDLFGFQLVAGEASIPDYVAVAGISGQSMEDTRSSNDSGAPMRKIVSSQLLFDYPVGGSPGVGRLYLLTPNIGPTFSPNFRMGFLRVSP
jgi:hypothetical protein